MSNSSPPLRIAIVGGGVAGLFAALAFEKQRKEGANIDFKVYERSPKYTEIGAGIGFGPNAQRALHMLGPEVMDAIYKVTKNEYIDKDIWIVFKQGEADHPDQLKEIYTIRETNASACNCHRADLLNELSPLLPAERSVFAHECTGYEVKSDSLLLHFKDKPDQEVDVVLAADGVKSRMRRFMYERKGLNIDDQKARYSEWVVWRGLIPVEELERFPDLDRRSMNLYCGVDKHLLHFPVRNGELVNVVGFVRDPNHKKLGDHDGPWSEFRDKEEMLQDFSGFSPVALEMLKAIPNPSIWGIFTVPALPTSTDERLVLIGDSAHAMTPHQGAGAGQGIESALFLASLLSHPKVANAPLTQRASQIESVLRLFDQKRHTRATKVQQTSHEGGMLYECRGLQGEGSDTRKIRESLRHRMEWIWRYDLADEIKQCVEML